MEENVQGKNQEISFLLTYGQLIYEMMTYSIQQMHIELCLFPSNATKTRKTSSLSPRCSQFGGGKVSLTQHIRCYRWPVSRVLDVEDKGSDSFCLGRHRNFSEGTHLWKNAFLCRDKDIKGIQSNKMNTDLCSLDTFLEAYVLEA